jgi:hypothetical protein
VGAMLLCALREWDRRLDFICATEGKKGDGQEKTIVFDEPSKVLSLIMKRVEAKGWMYDECHKDWSDYVEVFWFEEHVRKCIRFEVNWDLENGEEKGFKLRMSLGGQKKGMFSRLKKDATKKKCIEKIEGLLKTAEEWKHPASAVKA